jgi:formate/nitrite transporter FocA (FNT family)
MKGALNWIAVCVAIVCGALCSLGFPVAYVLRVEGNPVWARVLCIITPICVGLGITSFFAAVLAVRRGSALNWIAACITIVCGALCSLGFAASYVLHTTGDPAWTRVLCIVTPICVGLGIMTVLSAVVAIAYSPPPKELAAEQSVSQ